MFVPHVRHVRPVSPVRRVRVSQVTEAGPGRPLDSALLPVSGGWVVFHLGQTAAVRAGGSPLTLQLTEQTSGGQWRALHVSRRGHHHNRQPLLVLYSRDNSTAHHQAVNGEARRQPGTAGVPQEIRIGLGLSLVAKTWEQVIIRHGTMFAVV